MNRPTIRRGKVLELGRSTFSTITAATVLLLLNITVAVSAASWSSFQPAKFADIYFAPPLISETAIYTLTLGANPQVIINSNTYSIRWIGAFYAVGSDIDSEINAGPISSSVGWTWDAKQSPGDIAGWYSSGQNRLYPGQSAVFEYANFEVPTGNVIVGLHVGYDIGNNTIMTDFRRGTVSSPPYIPEFPAGSLAALGSVMFGIVIRRQSSR